MSEPRGGNPNNWSWQDEKFYIDSLNKQELIMYRKAVEKRTLIRMRDSTRLVTKESMVKYIEDRLLKRFNVPMAHLQDMKDRLKGSLH